MAMQSRAWLWASVLVLFVALVALATYGWILSSQLIRESDQLQAEALRLEISNNQQSTDLAEANTRFVAGIDVLSSQLSDTATALQTDLSNVETALSGAVAREGERLGVELEGVRGDIAGVRGDIASQDATIRGLTANIGDLEDSTARLRARVVGSESELQSLSTGFEVLSTKLDDLKVVDFNSVYRQTNRSVFLIETGAGSGSGWLFEPGLILTNQHVVAGFSVVTVRQAGSPPFTATVLAADSIRDIALLRFDPTTVEMDPLAAALTLGNISTANIAQPLLALGYSGVGVKGDGTVGAAAANAGVLSQIINFGDTSWGLNLIMDAPIDPGDSGGPVFNMDGEVVGMVRAGQIRTIGGQRVVGTFFAVHADEIRAALPTLKIGQSR